MRVGVDINKTVFIGFDHYDPEYDDARLIVDDAGNVIKDDVRPEAAFTTIRPVENEHAETMSREVLDSPIGTA